MRIRHAHANEPLPTTPRCGSVIGLLALIAAGAPAVDVSLASAVAFPGGRIAISHDGNSYDHDDIGATAMDTALLSAAGLSSRLVHLDYCCNMALNDASMYQEEKASALGGASRFGFDASRFFDDQTQLSAAIANFKAEAEKSSATDPLWFICAGPMEVPWRCVNAVNPAKRAFVHVISHSGWNDGFNGPNSSHTWNSLVALGVTAHHIIDQNTSNGDNDWQTPERYWYWLRDATNPNYQWVYSRDTSHFDVSDCGMTYWLISGGPNGGNEKAGWPEAKALLLGANPPPPPPPTNQPPTVNAGPDLSVSLVNGSASAALHGTAVDDGLPSGSLTRTWSTISGPAAVVFANASSADTTATFSAAGSYVLNLSASDGALSANDTVSVTVLGGSPGPGGPYGGSARSITSTIQAEDYDLGGEGVGYHDSDAANNGGGYRSDAVDIEACADAGGGFNVGWIVAGEWLEYTVTVPSTGSYTAQIRSASATAGGTIGIMLDGQVLGAVTVGGTGGWQTWATSSSSSMTMSSGTHRLRLVFDGSAGYLFNVNALTFVSAVTPPPPPANTAPTITAIGDQTIASGTTATASFTVGDAETAAGSLTVSASSSNTSLLPNSSIALANNGASRSATLTPASGQSGSATVTISVSDGSLSASRSFTLTVTAAPPPPPSGPSVTSFTLINATTDQPVAGFDPIPNGATISTTTLGTSALNIRANVSGAVASVRFDLDGVTGSRTENVAPYALAGDNNGDYNAWSLAYGAHSVKATAYSAAGATGTAGTAATVSFTLVQAAASMPKPTPTCATVTGFTLINATTNQPVAGFDPIPAGAVIDTSTLGTTELNLRANVSGTIGSVCFGVDATEHYAIENVAPYALGGDNAGHYYVWKLAPGQHTVIGTPYGSSGATGTAGTAAHVTFTIVTAPVGSG